MALVKSPVKKTVLRWLHIASMLGILISHPALAEDIDIGLDHPLQASGFIASSINVGDYNHAGRDLYSITDSFFRVKYQACAYDMYTYNEPYYGPPHSKHNVTDFSEALIDCAPSVESKAHFYAGRFQNFDRGNARYFYGLADGGNTIGNYAVFRQSPMIYFAVADQDGVGASYNFDSDTSWISRITYTDLDDRTMTLKPTYSSRLSTKLFGINEEFEIARIGSFNATQAALTLWGEHDINDTLKFQSANILIVEQTAVIRTEIWETVAGLIGKINANTQWKAGGGTIGLTATPATPNVKGYAFAGASHDLTDHLSVAAILTQSEKISGVSTILPSTVGMFSLSYRIR